MHRISAIRNRAGRIVGLTCRVGRAISGSAEMARDLVQSGGSLLLMGPPGVGKTTAIRFASKLQYMNFSSIAKFLWHVLFMYLVSFLSSHVALIVQVSSL